MRMNWLRLVAAVVTLVPVMLTGFSGTRGIEGQVMVSYGVSSPLTLHEPVIVEVSIENSLNEAIRFDLGHNRKSNFLISLTLPDGSILKVPPLSDEGMGLLGRISLDPLQRYSQNLLLNEWYDFDQPGNYQVWLRLATRIQTNSGLTINAPTEKLLNILIGPRNAELLRQRGEELTRTIEQSPSYDKTSEAALTLSYIKDQSAIPYLKKLLESKKHLEGFAISGLERIGTIDAKETLTWAAQSENEDTAVRAKAALARMGERVPKKQPEIKK